MGWTKAAVLTASSLLSVTWLSLTCLAITCGAANNSTEVPFRLYRGYVIVVRGSIGGLQNLNLLVDTGAVPSVVDARIARKLHLRGRSERVDVANQTLAAERVTVTDVVVGPSHVAALSVIIRDLSFAEDALGTKVDAMIGFDVLGQLAFTIDYESRKLTFGPIDPSFVTVRYSPGLTYALVPLHVQQETLAILVDTGASNLVLFKSGIRNCRSSVAIVGRETWTSIGGEMPVAKARLSNAYIGEEAWGQRMAYVPENSANQSVGVEGLLGTVALGKRVAFDPARRVMGWEPK